jgi:hypothetical protein
MPFQITPEIDFSSVGLITDMPAHSLPQGAWSDCLDIRVKDGSVQGVNDFIAGFGVHASYAAGEPVAVTQWTPAGSSFLNIAYIIKDTASTTGTKGRVFVYNSSTTQNVEITNAVASANFEIDDNYPPQLFVFNGVLICNPGTGNPQYISADATTNGNLVDLPNWASMAGTQYARVMRPYKNRLVAMSFYDDKDTATLADDAAYPIDFVWSSHITALDSIAAVEWQASLINTAGDSFMTQTPGRILDGRQLGEFFIAYKTDSVVRVYETGDNFVLGFDSIFEDDGLYSTRCVTTIGDSQHLVIGNYGVYIHDGQSQKQDIAKGLFQDTMFDLVKGTDKDKSFVFQQTRDKEVWFCFRETGTTGSGCNKAFVFNYADQKVHIRSLPNITDMYETEVEGALRIFATSPDTNSVKELSSSVLVSNGWFVRTEDDLGARAQYKDLDTMYPQSDGIVNIAVFGTSAKTSDSALNTGFNSTTRAFDPATGHKVDVRQSGRYINVRVTMSGTVNPKLTSIQFSLKPTSWR